MFYATYDQHFPSESEERAGYWVGFGTIHITFDDSAVHTGFTFSLPSSSSETSQVSDCHSRLVTTPCSRRILEKLMIEMTKDPIHPVGKNGKHLIKSNQCMDILHAFINYVRATLNYLQHCHQNASLHVLDQIMKLISVLLLLLLYLPLCHLYDCCLIAMDWT